MCPSSSRSHRPKTTRHSTHNPRLSFAIAIARSPRFLALSHSSVAASPHSFAPFCLSLSHLLARSYNRFAACLLGVCSSTLSIHTQINRRFKFQMLEGRETERVELRAATMSVDASASLLAVACFFCNWHSDRLRARGGCGHGREVRMASGARPSVRRSSPVAAAACSSACLLPLC